MKPQENAPEDSTALPVAEAPPEDQVHGMATDDDLTEAKKEEETD